MTVIIATGVQRVLRKTEDLRRELKWKSDAEAAAAAAAASSSSTVSSDTAAAATTEHQQSVVRSCFSRLRRGSELKTRLIPITNAGGYILKTRLASRLPRTTTDAKPASVEEEQEHGGDDVAGNVDDVTKQAGW